MHLRHCISVLLATLTLPHLVSAQSHLCADSSTLEPTAGERIGINIVSVEFRGENSLSDEIRAKLVEEIEKSNLTVPAASSDADWIEELNEVVVRGVLADHGYFTARPQTTPHLIKAELHRRNYVVTLEIESGLQYHLGDIRFKNVTAFATEELRKQIDLQPGELFNVSKIREAINSIYRLYSGSGYIDTTITPDTTIDKEKQRIDLVMTLHENKQYRVGTIEILGLGTDAASHLTALLRPGAVFDGNLLHRFFKENRSLLPEDTSPEKVSFIGRDSRSGTVAIVLDFRHCLTI